jgi:hypothetical protein
MSDDCSVCLQKVDIKQDDIVVLNGSCKHVLHARCWSERIERGSEGCPTCDPPKSSLILDDPLSIDVCRLARPDDEEIDDNNNPLSSVVVSFRQLYRSMNRALDSSIEHSKMSYMIQGLPVDQLRLKDVTVHTLLREQKGKLVAELMKNTTYSAQQLKVLGFEWTHWISGGLTEKNFTEVVKHYDVEFISLFVTEFKMVLELCSGDATRLPSVMPRAIYWTHIKESTKSIGEHLALIGVDKRILLSFQYSLQDLQTLGFDERVFKEVYKFTTDDLNFLIRGEQDLYDEFVHLFGGIFPYQETVSVPEIVPVVEQPEPTLSPAQLVEKARLEQALKRSRRKK